MNTAPLIVSIVAFATVGSGCSDKTGSLGGDGTGADASDATADGATTVTSDTVDDTATVTATDVANDSTSDASDTQANDTTVVTDATGDTGPVQICDPNAFVCESTSKKHQCNGDGTDFLASEACPAETSCRDGRCLAKCPNDPKFGVYVGCEFWATDLPNYPDPFVNPTPENSPWAVVISNPGLNQVTVSFEMPPLFSYTPTDPIVPPGEARAFELPSINVQGTSLRPKGVHVTATGPVTAHQFNPYDPRFSNDASLLLPDPLLGDEYAILSWTTAPLGLLGGGNSQNGYFTVIAAFDDTHVTIQPSAHVAASGPIPELQAGQLHTIRLNRGDVLSIQADPKTLFENGDISGSRVTADKPISVFGGHEEAVVGEPIPNREGGTDTPCCADHLEEQMLPFSLAGTSYFALHSPPRGQVDIEPDWWRIQALEAGVTITTNPPQPDANNVTLGSIGEFIEVKSTQSFTVTGTGKLQIGQYLASRDMTEDFNGDASLVLMVATERFRKAYVFLAPDYTNTSIFGSVEPDLYATIVKKQSVAVSVDGVAVAENTFVALGASGYVYTYVPITAGVHEASSTEAFGLYVYGYNSAVSFSYIGGIGIPGE